MAYIITGIVRVTNQVELKRVSDGKKFYFKPGIDLDHGYVVGQLITLGQEAI